MSKSQKFDRLFSKWGIHKNIYSHDFFQGLFYLYCKDKYAERTGGREDDLPSNDSFPK